MNHRKYWKYFLLIVGAGGLGCWISLVQFLVEELEAGRAAFIGNAATFAISVAVTSLADQVLIGEEDPEGSKGLTVLILVLLTLGVSCSSLLLTKPDTLYCSVSGMLFAMICWLLVNTRNKAFYKMAKPQHLLGDK